MPRITKTPTSIVAAAVWMIELMALVKSAKIAVIERGDIIKAMDFNHRGDEPIEAFKAVFADRI